MKENAAITVQQEDPGQADVVELLRQGEAHSAALYPAESNHHLPLDALRVPAVRFLVARDAAGKALATGAVVLRGDWAEIKRMYVAEEARGLGLSKTVLAAVTDVAAREGVATLKLETGVDSHAALGLYEKAGFRRCGPFGDYGPDPLSVFMEKAL